MAQAHDRHDRVVAVANLKGGVGKSTTVLNIAGFAAQAGKRVLVVDNDPQASVTAVLVADGDDVRGQSLTEGYGRRAKTLTGILRPSRVAGIDLVPSTLALDPMLQTIMAWSGREFLLSDMLAPHLAAYDLILIDCRPAVDVSVFNGLTAARWLLIPAECSFVAMDGIDHILAAAQSLYARINPTLALLGVLPTKHRTGTKHSTDALTEIVQRVADHQPPLQFAPIRLATAAADAPSYGQTLAEFAPKSDVGRDYQQATMQLLAFLERGQA